MVRHRTHCYHWSWWVAFNPLRCRLMYLIDSFLKTLVWGSSRTVPSHHLQHMGLLYALAHFCVSWSWGPMIVYLNSHCWISFYPFRIPRQQHHLICFASSARDSSTRRRNWTADWIGSLGERYHDRWIFGTVTRITTEVLFRFWFRLICVCQILVLPCQNLSLWGLHHRYYH